MATIAIGDIHGNHQALLDLLSRLEPEISADDEIVFLGDYIDRGPDSRACIDEILEFRARCPVPVTCLRGNHEQWMLRTMADYTKHSWLLVMEAIPTIKSYSESAALVIAARRASGGLALYLGEASLPYERFFDAMPQSHREFFQHLSEAHVTADALCTHETLDLDLETIRANAKGTFTWSASGIPDGGEVPVVYGHFNNAILDADGWPRPRMSATTVGIDTISHGVLTAVRLPERQVIQSRRFSD